MEYIDILFESANADFNIGLNGSDLYFTEAEKDSFMKSAVDKIKKAFETFRKKISEFFGSKKYKDTEAAAKDAIKEDPSLGKKTTKMTDYDALHKLGKETIDELKKPGADVEKLMAKYKKQRNAILGAGAAVVVSLTGLLSHVTTKHKKKEKELATLLEESSEALAQAADKNVSLDIENNELRDKNELLDDSNNALRKENEKLLKADKTLSKTLDENDKLKVKLHQTENRLESSIKSQADLSKQFKFASDIAKELLTFTFQETTETTKKIRELVGNIANAHSDNYNLHISPDSRVSDKDIIKMFGINNCRDKKALEDLYVQLRDEYNEFKTKYDKRISKFKNDPDSITSGDELIYGVNMIDKKKTELKCYNRALRIIQDRLKQA